MIKRKPVDQTKRIVVLLKSGKWIYMSREGKRIQQELDDDIRQLEREDEFARISFDRPNAEDFFRPSWLEEYNFRPSGTRTNPYLQDIIEISSEEPEIKEESSSEEP